MSTNQCCHNIGKQRCHNIHPTLSQCWCVCWVLCSFVASARVRQLSQDLTGSQYFIHAAPHSKTWPGTCFRPGSVFLSPVLRGMVPRENGTQKPAKNRPDPTHAPWGSAFPQVGYGTNLRRCTFKSPFHILHEVRSGKYHINTEISIRRDAQTRFGLGLLR